MFNYSEVILSRNQSHYIVAIVLKHSPDPSLVDDDGSLPRPHFRSAASCNSALRKHPTYSMLHISIHEIFSTLELTRWPKEKSFPTCWSKIPKSRGALVLMIQRILCKAADPHHFSYSFSANAAEQGKGPLRLSLLKLTFSAAMLQWITTFVCTTYPFGRLPSTEEWNVSQ